MKFLGGKINKLLCDSPVFFSKSVTTAYPHSPFRNECLKLYGDTKNRIKIIESINRSFKPHTIF